MTQSSATIESPLDAATARRSRHWLAEAMHESLRHYSARMGATWVIGMFALAALSPLLANSMPYVVKIDGHWSSPLLQHLSFIDVTLLVALITAIVLWCRRKTRFTIKVLIFFDVGGSMDPFIRVCEELFSAARSEFKHMEYFYFHNCLYDYVWKDNRRRWTDKIPTWDVLHKYPHDYKVIFVGDASMSPYEITVPGGAVDYFNEEPGALWIKRVTDVYERVVWLNPVHEKHWDYVPSTAMLRELIDDRMYCLTLSGLESAMKELVR